MPEEELRPEYRGGGLRRQRRGRLHRQSQVEARRQFQDATDQDIERLVREKWEAIESARAATPKVVVATPDVAQAPSETDQPVSLTLPVKPAALPEVPKLTAAVDPEATEARRRQREEEALLALLADLA